LRIKRTINDRVCFGKSGIHGWGRFARRNIMEGEMIDVGADKKRRHNRLNKGRMDLEYLKQVQEELLSNRVTMWMVFHKSLIDFLICAYVALENVMDCPEIPRRHKTVFLLGLGWGSFLGMVVYSFCVCKPTVMIKAKIDVVKEIREALTPTQVEIFEKTCFGHWFDWAKNLIDNPFRNRMFPHIEAKVLVKLSDVINIFDKMRKRSLVLEDNDAVRICLLVLLEHGFLGHQLLHNVSDDMLKLIWILDAIPATHRHVHKQPTKKILRLWLRSREYRLVGRDVVLCKHVQSEVVSEQLEIEKDGISEKKRKRGSQPSFQDLTYDQLMTTITKLVGTVATLTKTVLSLHGTIGTLESQFCGDARVSTLTQTISTLQGIIDTLESRLLALDICYLYMILIIEFERLAFKFGGKYIVEKDDERDFRVVSDGDIPAYMSPGPSYTSHGPLRTSPASTAHKSLPLANRRKLRVKRIPLKLKSPIRCYYLKERVKDAAKEAAKKAVKDAAKDTYLDAVTTMSVPMTTTECLTAPLSFVRLLVLYYFTCPQNPRLDNPNCASLSD
ncbi:hypothetical protein Tco_0255803, partial [Tanacetum coccineum]